MRFLKILLFIVFVLGAILFGGGLLLSPSFTIVRSVDIQAPATAVYPLIADPRRWNDWSVWNLRDRAMQVSYSGQSTGAGAGWAWRSESQGNGRMAFTAAEPPGKLEYELHFDDVERPSTGAFLLESAAAGATRVTWVMSGSMGTNPLMRWFALGIGPLIGRDFEAGLANLKTLAEKR
jgi:uncharacterized protein YndB with AHSA1/START domain